MLAASTEQRQMKPGTSAGRALTNDGCSRARSSYASLSISRGRSVHTVNGGAVEQGKCHDPDLPTNAGPAGCYTERERSGRCLHFEYARAPRVRIEHGAFRWTGLS